jgi:hypothetical protein
MIDCRSWSWTPPPPSMFGSGECTAGLHFALHHLWSHYGDFTASLLQVMWRELRSLVLYAAAGERWYRACPARMQV